MNDAAPGPLPGTYWVEPGRLLAGPYPGSFLAGRTRENLSALIDAGVSHFLDLTEPGELEAYAAEAHHQAALRGRAVQHLRLPIEDMRVPTPQHMRAILDALQAALDGGRTVYVHCWGGIGRTGTVVGCWLVRGGLDGDAALKRIVQLRGGLLDSPQTEEQFAFVRAWRAQEDGSR